MKAKKTWIALPMTTAVLLSACNGGSTPAPEAAAPSVEDEATVAADSVKTEGFPIVEEPIELNFFGGYAYSSNPDWNTVKLFEDYKTMTNVNVKWEMVPADGVEEKKHLMLSSGDYPHAFHTARFSAADLYRYGQQGIFVPLNDLIDEYAPNFKRILEQDPLTKQALTMPDGNIYSFPTYYDPDFLSLRTPAKPWIRQDWLETLGLEMPTTTEQFYQYLKAVKENDPNGNGVQDEIPYAGRGYNDLIQYLKGAWGLGNRGTAHPYVDVDPESGGLRFFRADERYKELLQYLNRLHTERLVNEDIFTLKSAEFYAQGAQGLFGTVIAYNANAPMQMDKYVGAPALEGPHGDRQYTYVTPAAIQEGAFVITDKNPNPEATIRWIDHFYSEEGSKMFFMGFEGLTYEELPDGSVEYVDSVRNSPDGLTQNQVLAKYLTWLGGNYPSVVYEDFFKGAETNPDTLEATATIKPHIIEEVWPRFNYTQDELDRLILLQDDIHTFINENEAAFISGARTFEEWDQYVGQLESMGLNEYLELYNQAYERYQESR